MAAAANNVQNGWHEGKTWNAAHTLSFQWKVPTRYQNLTYIGHGSYGVVFRATDMASSAVICQTLNSVVIVQETRKTVAIKKLLQPFSHELFAKRAYRELRLLGLLNHRDAQVVQLHDVFTPEQTLNEFQTLYFVFNFADFDLKRLIDSEYRFQESHIQQIIYSLMRGLKYLHSTGIIHRDIKPENIGISRNSYVSILDLGLSRVASNGIQTGNVVTLWWRAPEVIVNWERYDNKIDIWSVGCVMAELLRHAPLFSGINYTEVLSNIIRVIGTPTEQELNELCRPEARQFIREELPNIPRADFRALFPTLSEKGIDFLDRVLRFDPRQRPTAEEALRHPFLAAYHDPHLEPHRTPIVGLDEDAEYSISTWKELTWVLIKNFRPPIWTLVPTIGNGA